MDVVQRAQQGGVAAEPVEDEAVGVDQHEADRLVDQSLVQPRQHLVTAPEEQ